MATEEFDVIVVGAGISGLSSAQLLREQGVNVVVLEARDRVGGRTYSVHNDRCGYVDLGGAYVGPTQNRLLRLADELGVEHYPVNEKEDVVYFMKDYVKRYQSLQAPPTRNPFAIIDILNFLTKLDDYGSKIPIEAPWKCKYAEEWDNKTFKDFMDEEIWTAECYGLGKMLVRVLVACEPSEVSMLWFIWYIAQGHGVLRITSITNGAQERKFIGGAQTISNKMAELLKPENRLRLQHVVTTVTQEDYTVIVTTADNKVFKAKHLIMAIPTNIQHKITFTPTLPSLRNQLIQRSPMGSIIKAHVYYDTAFWREQGMCGSAVILDDDAIVCFIMDDTKPDGSYPGIIGFIAGNNARRLCTCTREERKMEFGKIVAKAFNSDKGLHPVHYEENNWMEEQFTGGCYTSTMPPGVLTKFARTMREPIGRMYFAGTETATEWSGYMDGAVQAGERAAREVLHEMGKISKDEIWQEEPDNQSVYPKPFNMSFFERHCPSVPTFIASGVLATVMGVSAVVLAVGSRLGYIDISAWM